MARTPGATVKKPYLGSARAYAWARMRVRHKAGEDFSITELMEHLSRRGKKVERTNIRVYVGVLFKAGVLEIIARCDNGKPERYRMIRDLGTLPPIEREDGSGITDPNLLKERQVRLEPIAGARRELYWKAIRVFGQRRAAFTVKDLIALVSDESGRSSAADVRRYLAALVASGHLSAVTINPCRTFRVVRDTGPKYPLVRADGTVYDPNDCTDSRCEVTA